MALKKRRASGIKRPWKKAGKYQIGKRQSRK